MTVMGKLMYLLWSEGYLRSSNYDTCDIVKDVVENWQQNREWKVDTEQVDFEILSLAREVLAESKSDGG